MTQEEKSLTPEEVRLALQEYIDAEEEEKDKNQSLLLLEKAFKKFESCQPELEEDYHTTSIPNISHQQEDYSHYGELDENPVYTQKLKDFYNCRTEMVLPTCNEDNQNNVLLVHNSIFEFIDYCINNPKRKNGHTEKKSFYLRKDYLINWINKLDPNIKKERDKLWDKEKALLNSKIIEFLASLNIFYSIHQISSIDKHYWYKFSFSSTFGVIKKDPNQTSFSQFILHEINKIKKTHSLYHPLLTNLKTQDKENDKIKEKVSSKKNIAIQELIPFTTSKNISYENKKTDFIKEKEEFILYSLFTIIKLHSHNTLSAYVSKEELENALSLLKEPVENLEFYLNKLKKGNKIFSWDIIKEHFSTYYKLYYYFFFSPSDIEEVCFFLKIYLKGASIKDKLIEIDLFHLSSLFAIESHLLLASIHRLEDSSYLKILYQHPYHQDLLKIKVL